MTVIRTAWDVGPRLWLVEAGRRDVVGGIGMKQRGEALGLAAPGAEFELAAAVEGDAVIGAVVVGVKQRPEGRKPGRLDVDCLSRPGLCGEIGPAVDRRIPGDAVPMGAQSSAGVRMREVRVFQPSAREGVRDAR